MISKKVKFISTAAIAVAVSAGTLAFAASHASTKAQEGAAEYRQSTFKMVRHHFGALGDMMKGKVEFDAEVFAANANALAALGTLAPNGFMVEGVAEGSEAKAEIWEDKAAFDEKMSAFTTTTAALAEAAKTGDEGAMKKAFGPAAKTCKGCHSEFRE